MAIVFHFQLVDQSPKEFAFMDPKGMYWVWLSYLQMEIYSQPECLISKANPVLATGKVIPAKAGNSFHLT